MKQRHRDGNMENGSREAQRQRAGPELQGTSSLALVVTPLAQKPKCKHDSGLMGVAPVCGRRERYACSDLLPPWPRGRL